jgi:selenocysteine lyase/cysteine desulfurase
MPVAALSALARARGCVAIVDGAQAAGGIDVDVKALGCHAYATSGHKWMLGPKGTGFLYLSDELGDRIDPIALQSGRAAYSASSGVGNIPGVLGLGAAIDYLDGIGRARIETNNLGLSARVYQALRTVPKIRIVSPRPGPLASPLVSYELPAAIPSLDLYQRLLDRHRVVVKVVPGNWFNGQRVSTHLFNTERDVDALAGALQAELA